MKGGIKVDVIYNDPGHILRKRTIRGDPNCKIQSLKKSLFTLPDYPLQECIFISNYNIIPNDVNLNILSQKAETTLISIPRVIPITLHVTPTDSEIFDIDITQPVKEIIKNILTFLKNSEKTAYQVFKSYVSESWRYALLYENKPYPFDKNAAFNNNSKYNICCSALPLCVHEWWYSDLTLIRYLCIDDETFLNKNDTDREFLLECCALSTQSGMSFFTTDDWISLTSDLILTKIQDTYFFTPDFVKDDCRTIFPPEINFTPTLVSNVLTTLKTSVKLLPKEHEMAYILQSMKSGCHFSYQEQVKVKSRVFSHKRFICVSSFNLMLYNQSTKTIESIQNIDDIIQIEINGKDNYFFDGCSYESNLHETRGSVEGQEDEPPLSIGESLDSSKKLSSTQSTTNINELTSKDSKITIYFTDGTNWAMRGRSPASVYRLKTYILEMMNLAKHSRKSLSLEVESSMNLPVSDDISSYIAANTNEELSIGNAEDPNSITENPIKSEDFFKSPIVIIKNLDNIDKKYIVNYEEPPKEEPKTEISYANYTKIIRPMDRQNDKNSENDEEFDYLKEVIPQIKISETIPVMPSDYKYEVLDYEEFFKLGENEKWYRNPFTITVIIIVLYKLFRLIVF